jgi:hypothetical protein
MQYAYIFLALFTVFKDSFAGAAKNKNVQTAVIGLALYWVYQYQKAKEDKATESQSVLDDTSPVARFSSQLHEAIFDVAFTLPILGTFNFNTRNAKIKEIAAEMGKTKCALAVAASYGKLYGADLTADLTKEGAIDDFRAGYNSVSYQGGQLGASTPQSPVSIGTSIKIGSNVISKNNMNLRRPVYANAGVLRTTKDNEKFKVIGINKTKAVIDPISKKNIPGTWITVRASNSIEYFLNLTGIKQVVL